MLSRLFSFYLISIAILLLVIVTVWLIPDSTAQELGKNGQRAFCSGGKALGFGCEEVDFMSFLSLSSLGSTSSCGGGKGLCSVNDLWGWSDPMTGKEYAIVGREDGTAFVDVTDPLNPEYLGNLAHNGIVPSVWRDMKVYADHVYIVADGFAGNGVQIFDLTQLRGLSGAPVEFEMSGLYAGISRAHNIVINEDSGFAYVVGYKNETPADDCGRGLHMIDLADPVNPVFAGCFMFPATGRFNDGYTHDAQCVIYHGPDADYLGREICIGLNETHVTIADVTDKSNPIAVSAATYPDVGYIHQGWLSEDHKFLFQNDELDERRNRVQNTRTLVWDVTNLDDPVLFATYFGPGKAIDHNVYVKGNSLYQSNYMDGLRILDISDPGSPIEVAHFDTFIREPASPTQFSGSWSNYPFFKNGVVAVTSRGEGLFLLQPTAATVVSIEPPEILESIVVSNAYPNPFSDRFTISMELLKTQHVEISIVDMVGRDLKTVYSGTVVAGSKQRIDVDFGDFPSGTYYYIITGDQFSVSKSIVHAR